MNGFPSRRRGRQRNPAYVPFSERCPMSKTANRTASPWKYWIWGWSRPLPGSSDNAARGSCNRSKPWFPPATCGATAVGRAESRRPEHKMQLPGLSDDLRAGETILCLICASKGNILMTHGPVHTIREGRTAQRCLRAVGRGQRRKRRRAPVVTALWAVSASGLALRPGCTRHVPTGRGRRGIDSDHHQDSRHLGGDLANSGPKPRPFHRRDRHARSAALLLGAGPPWLNGVRTPGPPFTTPGLSIACSMPSFRMPIPSWCPIGRTGFRLRRRP